MERDGSVANAAKGERTLPIAAGKNRGDGSLRVVASASDVCLQKVHRCLFSPSPARPSIAPSSPPFLSFPSRPADERIASCRFLSYYKPSARPTSATHLAFNVAPADPTTMEEPSLWARVLGQAAYQFTQMQPMIPTYAHLLLSALFPIYAGAHASLTRPSSAARRPKRKKKARNAHDEDGDSDDDDSEDEEDEQEHKMEGLAPTDAIMMPLFAGCALAALYFLLKWLQDPHYLNLILNWYFALFGVFAVSRLLTDALDIGHSILYPRRFARAGALYHVDPSRRHAVPVTGDTTDKGSLQSPLPGFLSYLPLPGRVRELLWADRAMPGNKWTLRLYVHRLFAGKVLLGPHGLVGALCSIVVWAYFNFVDKPWYLTNLIGFGFSYAALQLMSPTTFATGSLILGALFFYDIYFVFFTWVITRKLNRRMRG